MAAALVLAVILFAAFYAYRVIYENDPPVTQTAPCSAPDVTCGTAPVFQIASASLNTSGGSAVLDISIQNMERGVYPTNITVLVSDNVSVARVTTSASAWGTAVGSVMHFNFALPSDDISIMNGKVYALTVLACNGSPSSCSTNQVNVIAH